MPPRFRISNIRFMFSLSSQILHFLVPGLGSCTCAIAQSPVSATDQQRHQVSTGQMAQATAVQDGASWTTTWRFFVHLKMYPSNIFWRENDGNCAGARGTLQNFKVGQKAQPCLVSSGVFSAFVDPDETLFFVFQISHPWSPTEDLHSKLQQLIFEGNVGFPSLTPRK